MDSKREQTEQDGQNGAARTGCQHMIASTELPNQNWQDRKDRTVSTTRQPEQESPRTGQTTGQTEQDYLCMTVRTEPLGPGSQSRIVGKDSRDGTARTRQQEKDCQYTVLSGKDC